MQFSPRLVLVHFKARFTVLKVSGELEVREESFVDWDECHGPMDTPANRRSYPENFQWTCCDNTALSSGCVRREHRPIVAKKRKRFEE